MARASGYNRVTKMLFIAAVSGLDAPRMLARRGVLAQSLLFVPGVANAGIADQLEAASRASEITYSQNLCVNQPVRRVHPICDAPRQLIHTLARTSPVRLYRVVTPVSRSVQL